MRRILMFLTLASVVFLTGCGKDQVARDDLQATKDALNAYHAELYAWQEKVYNAICQLEADLYDFADSGGDTRAAGPSSAPGSHRLCPVGPGDPDGRPPEPPKL
jgi:hypothetical protein